MNTRVLGVSLEVSEQGLGCMGMSEFYGAGDDNESLATIAEALDSGVNFLDTADMYGPFKNEQLVGRAIATRRADVVLATKFGNQRGEDGSFLGVNGRPEYVRSSCDASLARSSGWSTSICTTNTEWIERSPLKRRGERWRSWWSRAKFATWVFRKRPRPPSNGLTVFTR
jgi:hypothetical protein